MVEQIFEVLDLGADSFASDRSKRAQHLRRNMMPFGQFD
jgi:hypothetical protein